MNNSTPAGIPAGVLLFRWVMVLCYLCHGQAYRLPVVIFRQKFTKRLFVWAGSVV